MSVNISQALTILGNTLKEAIAAGRIAERRNCVAELRYQARLHEKAGNLDTRNVLETAAGKLAQSLPETARPELVVRS